MTSFHLKIIAMFTMLIDHIGAILFPQYIILRIIGRMSFMIYCFLLVEGYFHTRNVKKYLLRILMFAFISEIPFDLAFQGQIFNIGYQNIFFTLFIGLMCISICEHFKTNMAGIVCCVFVCGLIAEIISSDYGAIGVLMIVGFYLFRNDIWKILVWEFLCTVFLPYQIFSLVAFIPIKFYNKEKGKSIGYMAYAFYPLHLIILYIVHLFF